MSDPYISLNGQRTTSAVITIPFYGAWIADVVLALTASIPTQSRLTVGNLSLVGNVYRMATYVGSRSARIVGGFGGWRKVLPPQYYQNLGGIRLSTVLGDAAISVGEKINVASDISVGTSYARETGPASRLLRQLAGPEWWVDNVGTTQIGSRPSSQITSPFEVAAWSGARGMFEVSTETVGDWMPARTFQSSNISTQQTVGVTIVESNNDGKLRLTVLNTGSGPQ
jgi:hypothetical protein